MKGVTINSSAPGQVTEISIHTPVKGVTRQQQQLQQQRRQISIHTPVKGVTVNGTFDRAGYRKFQSTHP